MKNRNLGHLTSKKLRNRLEYLFNSYHVNGEFEDFFQGYCLHILEGRGQHQTLQQYTIDCLRSDLGRTGSRKEFANAGELFDSHCVVNDKVEDQVNISTIIERLSGTKRTMAILICKYGFNEEELAFVFGVSGSRISQVLKELREKAWNLKTI